MSEPCSMTLTCVEEVGRIHQGCITYPRLYVRALLDDVNLCGRGCCDGAQQRAVELSLQGGLEECEVADLYAKDYQQVHYPGVTVDVFLAEEDESLLEDFRVELLQFLADLVGEELPPVAVVSAAESLAGVEGSRYETPPSFEFSLPGRVPRFLLQLHFAPQGRKKQISSWTEFWRHLGVGQSFGLSWNSDRIPASLGNPAVVEEEFLPSFPSSLLFFFSSLALGPPSWRNEGSIYRFLRVAWLVNKGEIRGFPRQTH
ncbi:hypothetical protein M5K25_012797 [Dendrobium thyrsiflorum]|uniref:Uncharacterized protein n=1 Tax=Dendrobium thyrsiflorum TaxID=117978 RepID=A0ABD0UYF6_DENTH